MSDTKRIRELELQNALERHLQGEVRQDRARDILLDAIKDTPSGKYYINTGKNKPQPVELSGEVWATPTGQDLRGVLDESAAHENNTAEAERTKQMNEIKAIADPAQRMAAFRKAGGTK